MSFGFGLGFPRNRPFAGGPSLDFQFAGSTTLDPQITFTRASTATFFDSAGVLQSAAIDVPRLDYDPATLLPRGFLVEEQRTNLVLQSQDFATSWATSSSPTITTNTTVAPDGTTTADTIAATATGSYVAQIITFTGDGTKAYSFFIKAGTSGNTRVFIRDTTASASRGQVDIVWTGGVPSPTVTNGSLQSLQACPNGWYRVSVIADSVVAANTNQFRIQPDNVSGTGNIIIWGFQGENGAFSTSYIPTTTTALTRSADLASVNPLSPWFNQAEGSLYLQGKTDSPVVNTYLGIIQGSSSVFDGAGAFIDTAGTRVVMRVRDISVGDSSTIGTQVITLGQQIKVAVGYYDNAGSAGGSVNGNTAVTATRSMPVCNALYIGCNGGPSAFFNGWIQRITYYPRRLSNAELQAITA